jgi:hypothetical protein
MPQPATPDATICPLCGQGNRCAMELEKETGAKQGACWCTQLDFNRAVLEAIPVEARRKACICQACATRAVPAP